MAKTCIPCEAGEHKHCWHDAVYEPCTCFMRFHYPPDCSRCGHMRESHAHGLDFRDCHANDCTCPQMER